MGRILLAESDDVSARAGRAILEKLGFIVDVVETGVEAVEHFIEIPYRLVLMDALMPEMNGFEATARIRQHPRGPQTPIVGTTANWSRGECLKAGMDDLMPKPFERAKIASVLDRWLPAATDVDN